MIKKQPDPSAKPEPSARDRRSWSRYAAKPVDVSVIAGSHRLMGTLVDESIGGLGISVSDVSQIAYWQQIQVTLRDSQTLGYVRDIRRESPTAFRLSICWDHTYAEIKGQRRKSIANYVVHDNLLLVCDLMFADDDSRKKVRLWNGARFQVQPEEVCSRSYDVRRSELNRINDANEMLAKLYELPPVPRSEERIDQILDFEFQLDWSINSNSA